MSKQLVCQYLENVSREVLEEYQHIVKQYIRKRHGVYALYRKNKLYYVGLASNLKQRLGHHLRDRHAHTWDRFSVYITLKDNHLKELESLVLRIMRPKGNRQKGKFHKTDNIKKRFKKDVRRYLRMKMQDLFPSAKYEKEMQEEAVKEGREPALKQYVGKIGHRLKMIYKGKTYIARVRKSGKIRFKKHKFNSPSLASSAVLKRPSNGWYWWKYQRSPGEWIRIDELRK